VIKLQGDFNWIDSKIEYRDSNALANSWNVKSVKNSWSNYSFWIDYRGDEDALGRRAKADHNDQVNFYNVGWKAVGWR